MTKRKLKPFVVPMIYILSIAMLITSVFFIEKIINNITLKDNQLEEETTTEDVFTEEIEENIPVVNADVQIIKPYTNEEVKIVKSYYDYKADSKEQEDSIIYYGDTYMQNSGVDYSMNSEFDVISILEGTVTEVIEDESMGKTIKIQHNNNLVSVYQSMGTINLKKDDVVAQGQIIGKSGTCNVSSELGNHLHFELYYQGNIVNPEEYYGKLSKELN